MAKGFLTFRDHEIEQKKRKKENTGIKVLSF